jgi:hypothetical protein
MRIKIHVSHKHETTLVYIHGLENVFKILQKYGLEPYEDEEGIIVWFGYLEGSRVKKLVEELKKVTDVELEKSRE